MAKLSSIKKNQSRLKLIEKMKNKRMKLKELIKDKNIFRGKISLSK